MYFGCTSLLETEHPVLWKTAKSLILVLLQTPMPLLKIPALQLGHSLQNNKVGQEYKNWPICNTKEFKIDSRGVKSKSI